MVCAASPAGPSPATLIGFGIYFSALLSGGECYKYRWFSGGNSTQPVTWCQRSDGLNVTGEEACLIVTWFCLESPRENLKNDFAPPTFHKVFDETCSSLLRHTEQVPGE